MLARRSRAAGAAARAAECRAVEEAVRVAITLCAPLLPRACRRTTLQAVGVGLAGTAVSLALLINSQLDADGAYGALPGVPSALLPLLCCTAAAAGGRAFALPATARREARLPPVRFDAGQGIGEPGRASLVPAPRHAQPSAPRPPTLCPGRGSARKLMTPSQITPTGGCAALGFRVCLPAAHVAAGDMAWGPWAAVGRPARRPLLPSCPRMLTPQTPAARPCTPPGIIYSSQVKDLGDLMLDDEAAEREAQAQVGCCAWRGGGRAAGRCRPAPHAALPRPDRQPPARRAVAASAGRRAWLLRRPLLQGVCGRRGRVRPV